MAPITREDGDLSGSIKLVRASVVPRPLGRRSRRSCPAWCRALRCSRRPRAVCTTIGREHLVPAERRGERVAARMLIPTAAAAVRDQRRSRPPRPDDLQSLQQRHTRGQHRAQVPGEPADRHLAEQLPEDRHPQLRGIHDPAAPVRVCRTRTHPIVPTTLGRAVPAAPRSTSAKNTSTRVGAGNCPPRSLNMFREHRNDEISMPMTAQHLDHETPRRGRSSPT